MTEFIEGILRGGDFFIDTQSAPIELHGLGSDRLTQAAGRRVTVEGSATRKGHVIESIAVVGVHIQDELL